MYYLGTLVDFMISENTRRIPLRKKSSCSDLFWSAFFPDFLAFKLNKERYWTQKIRTRIIPNTDSFYAVSSNSKTGIRWWKQCNSINLSSRQACAYPAGNYMFKVNNRNTRCETFLKLAIKTTEWLTGWAHSKPSKINSYSSYKIELTWRNRC